MTGRKFALALISVSLIFALVGRPGWAVGLEISGTVSAPNEVSLSGVSVTDGTRTSVTDSAGRYSVQELQFGTYTVTASRAGLTSSSATVELTPTSPSATQNFALRYLSVVTVNSVYVTTAAAPATLTATLSSYAPNPGSQGTGGASCATITDSRTGNEHVLTHSGYSSGQTLWSTSLSIPQNASEGSFNLIGTVKDCASGVQIDVGASRSYTVDNTAPIIHDLVPADHGNIARTQAPVKAVVEDERSGVDSSSIEMFLTQGATESPLELASYDAENGIATSEMVTYVVGQTYRSRVSIRDRAGNEASRTAEFLAIGWTQLTQPVPSLSYEDPVFQGLNGAGKALWLFPAITLTIPSYSLSISGTRHAGWGAIPSLVDLRAVDVEYVTDEEAPQVWRVPARNFPDWDDGFIVGQQIALMAPASSFNNAIVETARANVPLGPFSLELPASAATPALRFQDIGILRYVPGEIACICTGCVDPDRIGEYLNYEVDYLVTYVADDEANDLLLEIAAGQEAVMCDALRPAPNEVSPDYLACRAAQPVRLAVGLFLAPYTDAQGTFRPFWIDSKQYAYWLVPVGPAPNGASIEQFAAQAVGEPDTLPAQVGWIDNLCGLAYCWGPLADESWTLESGDPQDDASAYATKCSDNKLLEQNPDRKACKQAGAIEVSDWIARDNSREHHLYAGWYRTRGTSDGAEESLGAAWSRPRSPSNFRWGQSATSVHVSAKGRVHQGGRCDNRMISTGIEGFTNSYVRDLYGHTDLRPVVRTRADFTTDEIPNGTGQQMKYMQGWYTTRICTFSDGSQHNYDVKWLATSTGISVVATAPTQSNLPGRILGQLMHIVHEPRIDRYLECFLTGVAINYAVGGGSPQGIIASAIGCATNNPARRWAIDVETGQIF